MESQALAQPFPMAAAWQWLHWALQVLVGARGLLPGESPPEVLEPLSHPHPVVPMGCTLPFARAPACWSSTLPFPPQCVPGGQQGRMQCRNPKALPMLWVFPVLELLVRPHAFPISGCAGHTPVQPQPGCSHLPGSSPHPAAPSHPSCPWCPLQGCVSTGSTIPAPSCSWEPAGPWGGEE